MKIAVLALGSRGDVQPAVALAQRLARVAEVVLIAPRDFAALSAGRGFAFHPMPIDASAEVRSDWTPPPALARFLEAGPPPVYIGFGSMAFLDSEATFAAVAGALRKTGARAIVGAGWGGLRPEDLPETVYVLDEAPHDWLFPRMAAIVHHGGAGTTGAALRAGKPSVVTPFIVDQFPWGRLLHERGLAPAPLPHRALTAEALAAAMQTALTDDAMRRRAEEIGAKVRADDGVARAAEIVLRAAV